MLDGIWVPIEAEMGGAKLPAALLEGMRRTIRGTTYDARVAGQTARGLGDRMRVCYALGGPPRPDPFETVGGPHLFLVTYRRTTP